MSLTYAKYMDAVTVRHRSISYNQLAPTGDPSVVDLKPKKLELSFSQSVEILGPYCGIRILDQLKAVVPLAAYLMLFQILVLRHPIDSAITLCLGLVAVIVGLAVFMEGLSTGLMPFGNIIGDNLPKKASMGVVLLIIGILGVGVTFAEPAIGALQAFGASVDVTRAPYLYELLNNWTRLLYLWSAGVLASLLYLVL